MTTRSPVPLARCSSHDQIRPHQTTHEPPSPTPPPRSNSFVLSRRCGVVSEQDVLRLAAATFDGGRLAGDAARPPPRTPLTTAQTASSPRPAAVLRQRSADCRPRPQSIGGYLEPLFAAETPVTPRVNGHGPLTVDPQLRLQNVPLLPNRQPIQQPAENRWRQWDNTPQRKGRPFGDVQLSSPTDNGWRPTVRNGVSTQQPGARPDEQQQQLLAEREAELRAVRSTMERNEAAILHAMEDQRRAWEAEAVAERETWGRRLRDAQQQIDNVRQTLTERIVDLERENSALRSTGVEHAPYDHHGPYPRRNDEQLATVRSQRLPPADEVSDRGDGGFSQSPLINGVDGGRPPHSARTLGVGSITTSTGRTTTELLNGGESAIGTDSAVPRLPAIPEGPAAATRCQHCEAIGRELDRVRQEFDAERQQWLVEKRRVISYQKLIQNKYLQMERRCAQLEGSTVAEFPNHVDTANSVVDGHAPRGGWNSKPAKSSFFSRLIPFGQAVQT